MMLVITLVGFCTGMHLCSMARRQAVRPVYHGARPEVGTKFLGLHAGSSLFSAPHDQPLQRPAAMEALQQRLWRLNMQTPSDSHPCHTISQKKSSLA